MIICENERGEVVGELSTYVERHASRVILRSVEDFESPYSNSPFPNPSNPLTRGSLNDIMLVIEHREHSIIVDRFQQASMRGAGEVENWVRNSLARRIPAGADVSVAAHQELLSADMVYRATWQVAVIPDAMSEQVFDFPQFTPH